MKSLILTCFLLLVSIGFGQIDQLEYRGGTYSFGKNIEKESVGNIVIYPISSTKSLFYLEVCRGAPSYNLGLLFGELEMNGSKGIYQSEGDDSIGCKLQFEFNGKQLVVDYLNENTSCGFGHAVYANNTYKLTTKSISESVIYANGDTIHFVVNNPPRVVMDSYGLPERSHDEDANAPNVADLFSYDCMWAQNTDLNQVLIEGIDMENNESISIHFDADNVPDAVLRSIPLTNENGEPVSDEEKLIKLKSEKIDAAEVEKSAFTSVQHVSLGDSKEKLIEMYGRPDFVSTGDGIEWLSWQFSGELDYSPYFHEKDIRVVADGLGYTVEAYFKDGKLIAQVLRREMP